MNHKRLFSHFAIKSDKTSTTRMTDKRDKFYLPLVNIERQVVKRYFFDEKLMKTNFK